WRVLQRRTRHAHLTLTASMATILLRYIAGWTHGLCRLLGPCAVLPLNSGSLSGMIMRTGSRYCTRQQLAEAVELVAQGRIRPVITRVGQLEEADEVLRRIERMELAGHACVMLPQA